MYDLSIFIPTHHITSRAYASIMQAVALAEKFPNIQVVISDNSGNQDKKAFFAKLGISNLKIVEAPLDRNYDFALKQTEGRYVLPMGDDDTLLGATLPTIIEGLDREPQFIGAIGIISREVAGGYEFSNPIGLDSSGIIDRVQGWLRCIPYGNPIYHTVIRKEVMERCYKFFYSIPNFQAYHDQLATLFLIVSGRMMKYDSLYFIYNFCNWGISTRVNSEIYHAQSVGMPKSIVLIQRLLLAVEGLMLICSCTAFPENEKQAAGAQWFEKWHSLFLLSLREEYKDRSPFSGCDFLDDIEALVSKYSVQQTFDMGKILDDLETIYNRINGSGDDYVSFWLSAGSYLK